LPGEIAETWTACILTPTGSAYIHTTPVITVTNEVVKGDHITEEITYINGLPWKIRKGYFCIPYLQVTSPCNADCESA
jgi:hypothetical protein